MHRARPLRRVELRDERRERDEALDATPLSVSAIESQAPESEELPTSEFAAIPPVADAGNDPDIIAMDLLSQAEHDEDAQPTTIASGRFIRLMRRGTWEYAERLGTTGAVIIIAVTDDRKLLLIEQPRPALGCPVIELPAGLAEQGNDARLARRVEHALLDRASLGLAAAVGASEDENNLCNEGGG